MTAIEHRRRPPAALALQFHSRHRHRGPDAPRSTATPSCRRAFLPSPTAICTSAMPRPSVSTSASPTSSAASTNLRFDDTNPEKEEQEYVDSIMADVRWLGFDWDDGSATPPTTSISSTSGRSSSSSDGKAYVDDLTAEEIRQHRGTLTEPGKNSPYRDRSVEENLDLFERMRAGEFPDGSPRAARQDRHGVAQPQHARSGDVPHPARRRITAPATSGASTRCTTTRTDSRIAWSASRTRCARWSSPIIARSMTGTSSSSAFSPRSRSSSTASTSPTPCSASASCCSWCRRSTSAAGTIRACQRSPASAAAAYTPEAIRNFCRRHRRLAHQRHHRCRDAGALQSAKT